MHKIIHFLFTGFFLLTALTGSATVRLPALFSDNMVLQRGMTVRIWGWADEGEGVLVNFRDQEEYTVAKDGKWCVELSSLKAGGPDVLKVSGRNAIEVTNVLVGEVWVCSGQSNMEWPLQSSFEPQSAISASSNPNLRLFAVPNLKANEFVRDVKSSWKPSSPETTPGFSAVG